MFKLGVTVKEQITNFRGVVTGQCEYITGCRQYLVTSKSNGEAKWYDEDRLLQVGKDVLTLKKTNNGPDIQAPNKG